MPRPSRSRRQTPDYDDDFEDDFEEESYGRDVSRERLRQLGLDLVGRWHWIALGLIFGILGAFYYLSKAPKQYEATSQVLVKQHTGSVMTMTRDQQMEEIDLRSLEALNTVAARMKRPELLQRVASRPDIRSLPGLVPVTVLWVPEWAADWLGLEVPADKPAGYVPPAPELAAMISGWLEVSLQRNTRLLDVTITHTEPAVAKALSDAIAVEYQAELTGNRSQGRSSSLEILIKESETARERLQTAQNALANYERALTTLKELEMREAVVLELSRRYLPKHPKMAAANAELATFQERFLSEFESVRNSGAVQASAPDREYWLATDSELSGAADATARLQAARRLLVARGTVLGGEIESQSNVFNSLLTRIQESDINQQAVESEMEISSMALLPELPASPKRALVLAGGGVVGLGLGTLLAFLFVRLDNKLHTVAQAERETGLPVLAAVANIQTKILADAVKKRKINESLIPHSRKRWDQRLVFREGLSQTTYAEMFRVLRASVSLLGDEKKRRITLFSSALPGEGKTLVSCNFALAAAQQGKRTLLIDLDLRKPAVHKVFGLQRDTHGLGATEFLAGQTDFDGAIYKQSGEDNLHIMLSGKQAPNPGELLSASTLENLLRMAADQYDLVVLDSAPLLAVPDTRMIAPLAHNFCLVTRAEYVPKGAVRRVIELLSGDQSAPAGIVFNGFLEKRRLIGQNYSYGNYQTNRYGRAYRYGYGSYGTYGSEEA